MRSPGDEYRPRSGSGCRSHPTTSPHAPRSSASSKPMPGSSRSPTAWSRRGSTALPRDSSSMSGRTASSRITPHRWTRRGSRCATRSRRRCAPQRQVYADDLAARVRSTSRSIASSPRLQPVHEFGKLGAVVLPFPSYFALEHASLDYLAWLRERSGDLPLAVELRHREWLDPEPPGRHAEILRGAPALLRVRRRASGVPELAPAAHRRHRRPRGRALPRPERRRVGAGRRHRGRSHVLRLPTR